MAGARLTVLDMVQDIMSSIDGDEINSISDTAEAIQVTDILQETYYEVLTRSDWAYFRRLEQLESVGDTSQPTRIKIPETMVNIHELRYRVDTASDDNEMWKTLKYLTPEQFLRKTQNNASGEDNVVTIQTAEGIRFYVKDDAMPTYYTSFDNQFIYLDSYDADEETTVNESRTAVVAQVIPAFTRTDTTIPDIPTQMFPYLLNEAKSKAFINLRQQANTKVEIIARRQLAKLREQEDRVDRTRRFVNYGR